jgi:hypothetical protein
MSDHIEEEQEGAEGEEYHHFRNPASENGHGPPR